MQESCVEMVNEVWKDIQGYEGLYQISNLGRVKSLEHVVVTKAGWSFTVREKLLKSHNNGSGYLFVHLCSNYEVSQQLVHRIVAKHFLDFVPGKHFVNHKDGNKQNNCVDNLEWVTTAENNKHSRAIGLQPERSPEAIRKMVQASKLACSIPVRCLNTGKIYESSEEAGRCLHISATGIRGSIKNGKPIKGYQFEEVRKCQ